MQYENIFIRTMSAYKKRGKWNAFVVYSFLLGLLSTKAPS